MADAVGGRLILLHLPVDFEKTCNLAHVLISRPSWSPRSAPARSPAISVKPRRRRRDQLGALTPCDGGAVYSAATPIRMRSISSSARRYSTGMTLRNFGR